MARYKENAPYKQSRAALRDIYGPRAITSGGQSPHDFTPSGRRAYLEERMGNREVDERMDQQWRSQFQPRGIMRDLNGAPPIVEGVAPRFQTAPQRRMFPGGLASPEDVGILRSQGATGTVRTPYGTVTLPPIEESVESLAEFLPATASPLSNFSLPSRRNYMSSVLESANKWRQPI